MTKEQCKTIKDKLPKGSRSVIQQKTSLTLGYIDKVLNGTRFNKQVFHVAFDIIDTIKEDEQTVDERFNLVFNIQGDVCRTNPA